MILLVGAALLGQSLYRLLHVDVGLQADHLATLAVAAPAAKYSTNEQQAAFQRRVVNEASVLPGVQAVGVTSTPPLAGGNTVWIRVDGRPYHGEHNEVQYREISAGYFTALGARLVRGRQFREDEDASKPAVVIINQTMARQYFPGEDPLGKQLLYAPTTTQPAMEIVGIVEDIKEGPLDGVTDPTMYVAFEQDPTNGFRAGRQDGAVGRGDAVDVDGGDPSDRSGRLHVLRHDDDARDQHVAGRLLAAVVRVAGGRLRRGGVAARRDWVLRCRRVFGEPADEGDRRPHGAWGRAPDGASPDPRRSGTADDRRRRARPARSGGRGVADARHALRRALLGRADARAVRPSCPVGARRELHSRPSGGIRQPGRRPASRVVGSDPIFTTSSSVSLPDAPQ